jgi:hypothetical protein
VKLANGGATGSGGISGPGGTGGFSTGGAGGAATGGAGGGAAADTYFGCTSIADPTDSILVAKDSAQGMCIILNLAGVGGTDTFGLTFPRGWIVSGAARWPSSTVACTTAAALSWPAAQIRATSGTGTVTLNGAYGAAGSRRRADVPTRRLWSKRIRDSAGQGRSGSLRMQLVRSGQTHLDG